MAESDGGSYENSANARPTASSDESDVEEPIKLDIGVDISRNFERNSTHNDFGASASNVVEVPKKEDNPFSFKHFLRSDTNSYHSQGARPKVYCDGRPVSSISDLEIHNSSSNENKQGRIVPEFSSALPDFVQDHLVIEQCYLNQDNLHRKYGDPNNLPDFTPSRINRLDLNSSSRNERRSPVASKSIIPTPLDLPLVRPPTDFPLDLPVNELQAVGTRSCPASAEVAVSKSLPDFLADGAVRTNNEGSVQGQSPERDGDRLRHDLESYRWQLSEQTRRADLLQRELDLARHKEHEYTQNLGKALEHVEENLEKSNKRALAAENSVLRLKQEIKALTAEINCLKCENRELRGEEGAAGGPRFRWPSQRQTQRLANDLRSAASTAEHSLRQLLTGVDNLRMMASSLENMHRIEENSESDFDFDDTAGPAL